jgi:hypothetical protein
MSTSSACSTEHPRGYRHEQLAAAFDRIRDPRDWKAPIVAVISRSERAMVEEAVALFTDSTPDFEVAVDSADRLVVRAPGYRRCREGAGS